MDSKKKLIFDMGLNIIANAIPVFLLQIFILPSLASHMNDEKYGLFVTILSLLNMVPESLGNVLNNIRLILNKEDSKKNVECDYNVELIGMILFNIVAIILFYQICIRNESILDLILVIVVSIVWLIREYYIVAFRIQINYIYITISNLIMIAGYIVGYIFFLICGYWQFIYIWGYSFSIFYIFCKSDLWKEPLKISSNFRNITVQSVLLFIATFFTRLSTYADKILIYPVLGGTMVSIYYVATLFGKVISMAITPVSSVLLSYLARENKKNDKAFNLSFICSLAVCIIGYCVCILISRPLLTIIYPQYVDRAMEYIFITTGTVVITALISIVNPFVLKFFDMKWQVAINGGYAIFYIVISMGLLKIWGLYGFCLGTLVTSVCKLIFMLLVFYKCKERNI